MKATNNITPLKDEELDKVNGGIVVATIGVCAIGGTIIGGTMALMGKCFYDMFKEYYDYKKEQKKQKAESK